MGGIMKLLVYLLAIICVAAAVMYFTIPAGSLPKFVPGYDAGSVHMHIKHGVTAAIAAVVLFVIGWVLGRSRR
jgi:hypothetical protein